MFKKSLVACLALSALAMAACSSDNSNVKDSYSFESNGCATGKHEFSGSSQNEVRNQLCAALTNSELNQYCAYDLRRSHFEQKCPGMDWDIVKTNNASQIAGVPTRLDTSSVSRSYSFELNGCPTGEHRFTGESVEEVTQKMCAALKDDELNNNCAEAMRKDHFEENCEGTW